MSGFLRLSAALLAAIAMAPAASRARGPPAPAGKGPRGPNPRARPPANIPQRTVGGG